MVQKIPCQVLFPNFLPKILQTTLQLAVPTAVFLASAWVLYRSCTYKEVWLFLGENIVFQLATERTIFFKAKSNLFGSDIKKSAGNTLDKISYNYRYIKLVLIYK